MIFSSAIRRTATAFVLACVAGSTIVGLLHEPKTPPLAWTSLAIGAAALVLVLATKRSPKRDAGLFAVSGMGSGVFMGASTVGFPGSLPIWLWTIGAICLGTMTLVVDPEATQNKSVSHL
jgi:peptidoglycan/LPS O-acetylase OafA/YrhL